MFKLYWVKCIFGGSASSDRLPYACIITEPIKTLDFFLIVMQHHIVLQSGCLST